MKTWKIEMLVVALLLVATYHLAGGGFTERLGALAVLAAFGHTQVTERMREREAQKANPDVACHQWALGYFLAKEALWLAYFVLHESWSALVGVGVFLLYPLWRKWWRARRATPWFIDERVVYLNGRPFTLSATPDIHLGPPWLATVRVVLATAHDDDAVAEVELLGEGGLERV